MNIFQFTKDHRSKLLEMCSKLFPDLKLKFAEEDGDYQGDYLKSKDGIDIHWFEFCMTNLAYKLQNVDYEDFGFRIVLEDINPIDYLYERFKKSKWE